MRCSPLRLALGLSVYVSATVTDDASVAEDLTPLPLSVRRRLGGNQRGQALFLGKHVSKFNEHHCDVAAGQTWCPAKKKCLLVDDYNCPGLDAFQAEANLAKWQPGKEDLAAAEQQALEAEQHEAEMVVKVRAAMLAQSGESALPAKLESEQRLAEMVAEKQIESVARLKGHGSVPKIAEYAEDEMAKVAKAAAAYERKRMASAKTDAERLNIKMAADSEAWKAKKAAQQAKDQRDALAAIADLSTQMKAKKDEADRAEQSEMAVESKLLSLQQQRNAHDPVEKQWKTILQELHLSKEQLKQSQIAALARSAQADLCGKIVLAWKKNEAASDDPYAVNLRKHKAKWEHFEDPMILENTNKVGAANRAIDFEREHLKVQDEARKQLKHTKQIMTFLRKQQKLILTMETRMQHKAGAESTASGKASSTTTATIKYIIATAVVTIGLLFALLKMVSGGGSGGGTTSQYQRVKVDEEMASTDSKV